MHSAKTNRATKDCLNISDAEQRFGSTKLAAAAIRGALALAVLSALLLIAARPMQAQTEIVLHNFCYFADSCPFDTDGFDPESGLTSDGKGNFYGTTLFGGSVGVTGYVDGAGSVFEVSPNGGGGWDETVLYTFCSASNCADGATPYYSNVIFDSVGNLYGTTEMGGANNFGVVFELSPSGGGVWTETVLHSFEGGTDGEYPINGLIMDATGNLYGKTIYGPAGDGAIFELSPSEGSWTEQVIYGGGQSGANYAGLTMDAASNIFGSTDGTVFELSPNGNGGWASTVIHTFAGGPKDGNSAEGTLVLDNAGNLYGTTGSGGAHGYGTAYKLTPVKTGKKKGTWKEKLLYSFKGGLKNGSGPWAGIVFDTFGNIYGTTQYGGKSNVGTVFELVAPAGTGGYKEKLLWSFNNTDGSEPLGSLILDGSGNLYGTTIYGGTTYGSQSAGNGVVFELTP